MAAAHAGFALVQRVEHGWLGDFPTVINAQSDVDVRTALAPLGDEGPGHLAQDATLSLDEAVEQAMRSHGTRSRPATGWASLTPTERQVVEQVRLGRTNPEIAEAVRQTEDRVSLEGRRCGGAHVATGRRRRG